MGRIIFDITDIVYYAMHDKRVSGIQRVQARIIGEICKENKSVRMMFRDPGSGVFLSTDAQPLFSAPEFDSSRLLDQLGLINTSIFPPKAAIKQSLRKHGGNKLQRAMRKVSIYLTSVLNPKALEGQYGIVHIRKNKAIKKVPASLLKVTSPEDVLVFLGCNWQFDDLHRFAEMHKASGGRVIQVIHDLIPMNAPQFCGKETVETFLKFIERSKDFTTTYVTVSEHTRKELLSFLGEDASRFDIKTMSLAHEFSGFPRGKTIPHRKIDSAHGGVGDNYFLFVGTIELRKNVIGLLRAWEIIAESMGSATPKLIFAGRPGWDVSSFFQHRDSSDLLLKHTQVLLAPSDEDLAFLFSNCNALVYPSFYEGWGLPVGEAAWFGKISITSNVSSLPEVCGETAIYVDPHDHQGMAAAVINFMKAPQEQMVLQDAMRRKSLRSWRDVANHLLQICSTSSEDKYIEKARA